MAHKDNAQPSETVSYEVWYGADDFRYQQALTEDDALTIAKEHDDENHPNVVVLKVTTTKEEVERG